MDDALAQLEKRMGQKLGDPANPLLVSVRSGAKFSMPGMMNTILNLGLNDETVKALVAKSSNPRFAYDCYRRFIQMFGNVVLEIDKHDFDEVFDGQQEEGQGQARYRSDRRRSARQSSPTTRSWSRRRPASRSRRMPREQLAMAPRCRVPLLVQRPRHRTTAR